MSHSREAKVPRGGLLREQLDVGMVVKKDEGAPPAKECEELGGGHAAVEGGVAS